jgi:hypothetical protein
MLERLQRLVLAAGVCGLCWLVCNAPEKVLRLLLQIHAPNATPLWLLMVLDILTVGGVILTTVGLIYVIHFVLLWIWTGTGPF